jgi:hypothetical protein
MLDMLSGWLRWQWICLLFGFFGWIFVYDLWMGAYASWLCWLVILSLLAGAAGFAGCQCWLCCQC